MNTPMRSVLSRRLRGEPTTEPAGAAPELPRYSALAARLRADRLAADAAQTTSRSGVRALGVHEALADQRARRATSS